MPIAFDAAAQSSNTGASSLTYSHTVTGSNTILFVGATMDDGDNLTGITYGGAAMTLIDKISGGISANHYIYLYYLINPSTGANNVVISRSTSTGFLGGFSTSYTGAKQTGVPDASNKTAYAAASQTQITTGVTTVVDNCWIVCVAQVDNDGSPGTVNITQRGTTSGNGTSFGDTNAARSPAGLYTVGFEATGVGNQKGTVIGASFAPAGAGGVIISPVSTLSLLNVG